MRIVVFTGNPAIEVSAWWPILLATPGLEAVLICRQPPRLPAAVARRWWSNVWSGSRPRVPYRISRAAEAAGPLPAAGGPTPAPVETIETGDLGRLEVRARVAEWRADLGVSLGDAVLAPAVSALPTRGTIVLWLGGAPAGGRVRPGLGEMLAGAPRIGAAAHWLDAEPEAGRVIASATAPLYERDSLRVVQARAEELGRCVLAEALRLVAVGAAPGTERPPGGSALPAASLRQRVALAARLAARRAARALAPRAVGKAAASVVALVAYRPLRDLVRSAVRGHPLRVFSFHRVTHLCRDGMTVAPEVFARQLDYIRRHHDVVSLDDALEMVRSGRRLRRPAALVTFDDGYLSVWETAWPAMRERAMVGCCFVPTALVGTEARLPHDDASPVRALLGLMRWEQLLALRDAGWAIGAHSATHARLSEVSGEALRREVDGALATLRERLGEGPVAMAYPYGGRADISAEARERIRAAGYEACFSDVFGETARPADLHDLRRIELGGDHGTLDWKRHAHGISLERWRRA